MRLFPLRKNPLLAILVIVLVVLLALLVARAVAGHGFLCVCPACVAGVTGGAARKAAAAAAATTTHLMAPAGFQGEANGKPVDKRHVHFVELDGEGDGSSTRNFGHLHEVKAFRDQGAGEGELAHVHDISKSIERR